jgi:serum/glucocorticoid-regulated kinase 2
VNRLRLYTAKLFYVLECLHSFNVTYHNLKLQNILLNYLEHISLYDFGLCKLDIKDEGGTNTFCKTPEYLASELLLSQGYTKIVDW